MTWQMPKESEYTRPTDLCPHPEWWDSENIMATESQISKLIGAFVLAVQPQFVLEIGSHYGQTTENIARAIQENKHGMFVSIEVDQDLANVARQRVGDLPVEIITIDSALYVPDQPIDLLFIDGKSDRLSDFIRFNQFCRDGSLIIIHDTSQPGYKEQADQVKGFGLKWIELHNPRGLLIMVK